MAEGYGLMYSENLKKIRRFLRDPNGNIWEDAFLMRSWNDANRDFYRRHTFDETATVLRHPANYQMSYAFGWEWAHNQHEIGQTYLPFVSNWQSPMACCHLWESQSLSLSTGSDTVIGDRFVHPWEAFVTSTPADMPPNWFPYDYAQTLFMAYDDEPLDFIDLKTLISQDRAYKTYTGKSANYTIKDDISNEFYLYPKPSVIWSEVDGKADTGMVVNAETEQQDGFSYTFPFVFADVEVEIGSIIDGAGGETSINRGAAMDYLRTDSNVFLIYRQRPIDISSKTDEPAFPRYIQKYIEYDVLGKAYKANTDGKIASLSEYWEWRKSIGDEILGSFKYKRMADRDYRLTGTSGVPRRSRGPRLPSTYPPV